MARKKSSRPKLKVVKGARTRRTPKPTPQQVELARRWRMGGLGVESRKPLEGDVIPLLDGWIRRLEREAGLDSAANEK